MNAHIRKSLLLFLLVFNLPLQAIPEMISEGFSKATDIGLKCVPAAMAAFGGYVGWKAGDNFILNQFLAEELEKVKEEWYDAPESIQMQEARRRAQEKLNQFPPLSVEKLLAPACAFLVGVLTYKGASGVSNFFIEQRLLSKTGRNLVNNENIKNEILKPTLLEHIAENIRAEFRKENIDEGIINLNLAEWDRQTQEQWAHLHDKKAAHIIYNAIAKMFPGQDISEMLLNYRKNQLNGLLMLEKLARNDKDRLWFPREGSLQYEVVRKLTVFLENLSEEITPIKQAISRLDNHVEVTVQTPPPSLKGQIISTSVLSSIPFLISNIPTMARLYLNRPKKVTVSDKIVTIRGYLETLCAEFPDRASCSLPIFREYTIRVCSELQKAAAQLRMVPSDDTLYSYAQQLLEEVRTINSQVRECALEKGIDLPGSII